MNNLKYTCPICHNSLALHDKSLKCQNSHSFDIAKEGYVHLLPVQFKHSKQPGDNKAMVQARRDFLAAGHYQPLAERLTTLAKQYAIANPSVLDSGCGEGYYTNEHTKISEQVYGVDIAKEAIKKAAKKYKQCQFSVSSIAQYPFSNESFDWIYSIYAPLKESEFLRLLKEDGKLVTVTPAANHLFELKSLIYQTPEKHQDEKEPFNTLKLIHSEKLTYQFAMNTAQERLNLLSMTPFAFKSSDKLINKLNELSTMSCTADFHIRVYEK